MFTDANDAHDANDVERGSQPNLYPDIYTNITTHDLWADVRPEDSKANYNIKLAFIAFCPVCNQAGLFFGVTIETFFCFAGYARNFILFKGRHVCFSGAFEYESQT